MFSENCSEIIPNLYIGNYKAAMDIPLLHEKNIGAIINCTKTTPFVADFIDTVDQDVPEDVLAYIAATARVRIPVDDSLRIEDINKMTEYFDSVLPFLYNQYFQENKCVLVHCAAGRQRSAVVVAAFLYNHVVPSAYGSGTRDLHAVIRFMRRKRPEVFSYGWSINFKKSLEDYFSVQLDEKRI